MKKKFYFAIISLFLLNSIILFAAATSYTHSASTSTRKQVSYFNTSLIYKVHPGDTLSGIAQKANTSQDEIIMLYQQNSRSITPGDLIIFLDHYSTNNYSYEKYSALINQNTNLYTVKSGETLSSIAQNFGISLDAVIVLYQKTPKITSPGDKVFLIGAKHPSKSNISSTSPVNTAVSINKSNASSATLASPTQNIDYVAATYITPTQSSSVSSTSGGSTAGLTQAQIITKYSQMYDVNPNIIMAIIRVESGGNPVAQNGMNKGLMQISLPSAKLFDSSINSQNIYDPATNIRIGVLYFKTLLNQFNNNMVYALAAYNAGSKNAMNWISQNPNLSITDIPYAATRSYIQSVLSFYNAYSKKNN